MAFFEPVLIDHNFRTHTVVDMAAGDEFSIIVTINNQNDETEVFGCGHNLKGELGIGFLRHITDNVKLEGLSNYSMEESKI